MQDYNELFAFGSEGPLFMPPPGFKWQQVEAKKEEKKADEKKEEKKKEKPPEIVLKVTMCCGKCEEKVKEYIFDVPGVTDVKTDRIHNKVTVVGKADKSQVLKAAKKLRCRAKILEEEKKKEEDIKKKEDPKKKEEPNTTWTNDPRNFYPTFYPPYWSPYPALPPPFEADGTYSPCQAYPPHYNPYPETDYSYYNFPNNPRYLTHILHS
ncbi:unnamed protein product [Sphagnum compactum]